MCDLGAYTTSFKGVVIEKPILLLLLTFSYILSARSMSLKSDGNQKQFTINSNVGCTYLESKKELSCFCQNPKSSEKSISFEDRDYAIKLNDLLSESDVFKSYNQLRKFSNKFRRQETLQQVKKIRIGGNMQQSCKSLHLSLDFRQAPSSLSKLFIEDIQNVKVDDLILRPNETIHVSFRRINSSLIIAGKMICPGCSTPDKQVADELQTQIQSTRDELGAPSAKASQLQYNPKVKVEILEAGNVSFDSFVSGMGNQPNIRIQMRNADSVLIKDSYFNDLPSNGLEIFNVDNVTIFHSEFYNGSFNSIVVNGGVKNVHVNDCLMDKHLILPLNTNSTDIFFRCTTSPDTFLSQSGEENDPECVSNLSRWIGSRPNGVESTGAVVLALISAILLIFAVGFLFVLHRTGRLDQYV